MSQQELWNAQRRVFWYNIGIMKTIAENARDSKSIRTALLFSLFALSLFAQPGYTNHAGNVIAGWPVALTQTHVTLSEVRSNLYALSIFPESEQRRIAADFGEPRLPVAVKRAIAGAEKAMARSRKRAEKGLCTREESEAFGAKSLTALNAYLDRQVETGKISAAERKAVGVKHQHEDFGVIHAQGRSDGVRAATTGFSTTSSETWISIKVKTQGKDEIQ